MKPSTDAAQSHFTLFLRFFTFVSFILPSVLIWVHFYQPGGVDRLNSGILLHNRISQVSAELLIRLIPLFEIVGGLLAATARWLELCGGAPLATERPRYAHIHS